MAWHPFLRYPRTTQERRANQYDPELPPVRAKRRPHRLPNAWDDIFVQCGKSWKRTRGAQFRMVRSWGPWEPWRKPVPLTSHGRDTLLRVEPWTQEAFTCCW